MGRPKERKVAREGRGKEEEEGHEVVTGRWAPPPLEGKGPRNSQLMVIGQWAPPVADENNTPRQHAKPPKAGLISLIPPPDLLGRFRGVLH